MIHAILNGDFSHALETLLAVSVLILVVLMLRRTVSRQFGAGVVYLLWAIPVVRFFLPPLQTPVSMLSLDFAPAGEATAEMLAPLEPHVTLPASPPVVADWTPEAVTQAVAEPSTLSLAAQLMPALLAAGVAAWVAGAVFLAARNMLAHRQFMQTVDREAMPVSPRMADLVSRIAAETGLRRPPRLVASLISRGPFVTGLFRPVVVMPAWFEQDYTPMEARAALAHELMHVRRGDLWALQVYELFVAAMWFNPLAYIARDAFRTDQEAACDADVLRRCQTSPHAYGSTLVKAARLHLPEPVMAGARLPLTHALKERLTRMTYPVPSSLRRSVGFGAALLFGASALAITASVASAGEPGKDGTYEFRLESDGPLIVSEATDRQIVMLSDPLAKVLPDPPEPPEVEELQRQIDADVAMLTGPEVLGPIIAWHESEEWDEFADLASELAELEGETIEKTVTDADGKRVVSIIRSGGKEMTEAQRDALVAKLEAKAADIEARMAAREAEMDAHESRVESQAALLEARIEAKSAEIERIIEARYGGEEFESRVEAQTQLIEDLVEACEDAELNTGETRIIERTDAEGEVFRLACVQGDRKNLKSDSARAAVDKHPGITMAEKAAFDAAAGGKHFKSLYVFKSDASGPLEPMAPMAPMAPMEPMEPMAPMAPMAPMDPTESGLCPETSGAEPASESDCP